MSDQLQVPKSIRQLARCIQKLHLSNNSVILIQSNAVAREDLKTVSDLLQDFFVKAKISNVVMIHVKSLEDIKTIDEETMDKLGWVQKERIQGSILKLLQKQKKEEQEVPKETIDG